MLTPHLIASLVRPPLPAETKADVVSLLEQVHGRGQAPDASISLRDGGYGLQRNGKVVGPLAALEPGGPYAYHFGAEGWTADGRYIAHSNEPHPRDIIRITDSTRPF